MSAELRSVLAEMESVFGQLAPGAIDALADEVLRAKKIVVYGVGRNGLVMQGLAMRLAHLGLDGHWAGAMSAPPVGAGDLFLTALALGRLPTADALIATARAAGTRVAVITARPDAVAGADHVLALPAQTMADPMTSVLPLGSPFELALWLLCDLLVVALMARKGATNADLAGRHANLL